MDAKITKTRLGRMLSYDWLKIVFSAAALIVVWVLVFTMTATKIMPTQQFTVMNYVGNTSLNNEFYDHFDKVYNSDKFSYEVIELTTVDLAANESMAGSLLQARTAIEEGDVIFVADQDDYRSEEVEEIVDEATGEVTKKYTYANTYLESFIAGYYYQIYDASKYLDDMRAFLAQYYEDGDWKTPTVLNEEKIKDDFNARAQKDKRFKKASARAQGEKDEIERIRKYRDALVKFEWYLENDVVALTETVIEDFFSKEEDSALRGTFGINLCPADGMMVNGELAMSGLKNMTACYPIEMDEDGEPMYGEKTAENMNVCLFRFDGVGNGFQYENMLYIVDVIDTYSAHVCPEEVYAA